MPVGFSSSMPLDQPSAEDDPSPHDIPSDPWVLRFSRFVDEGGETGAHNLTGGVAARGAGITIAHMDTGYTLHPELMHGGRVRTADARTFTDPAPSMQSLIDIGPYLQQTLNVSAGLTVAVQRNGVQVSAGASAWIQFPNDGLDPLLGLFPSHGVATASLFMSGDGAPPPTNPPSYPSAARQAARLIAAKPIGGAAPEARYLPIRVSDTVIVDPVVANNMAMGIEHVAKLAQTDASIGVISISMGWWFGGQYPEYTALSKAIERATMAGVVVCAAAGQIGVGVSEALHSWAQTAESLAGTVQQGTAAAQEAARVARVLGAVAAFTGLSLGSSYPTVRALCDDLRQRALQAGRTADEVGQYLRYVEIMIRIGAGGLRAVGGPAYPGTDPNTICCAACDYLGDLLHDGFYGPQVDITAPGAWTYCARSELNAQGGVDHFVNRSSGTSFATALTAGACALWQAHHGRAQLIARFGKPLMTHAFRWALKISAATQTASGAQAPWDSRRRGFGMLDAAALLQAPLLADANALIEALRGADLIDDAARAVLRHHSNLN